MSRLTSTVHSLKKLTKDTGDILQDTAETVKDVVKGEAAKIKSIKEAVAYMLLPGVLSCTRIMATLPPETPILSPGSQPTVAAGRHSSDNSASGGASPPDLDRIKKDGIFVHKLKESRPPHKLDNML